MKDYVVASSNICSVVASC